MINWLVYLMLFVQSVNFVNVVAQPWKKFPLQIQSLLQFSQYVISCHDGT